MESKKMKNIELVVCDVDGVLTDGRIIYGDNAGELKFFNIKDGLILKYLPRLGVSVLLLTGRYSSAVQKRAQELGCDLLENISNKEEVLADYINQAGIKLEKVAYIGDDLNDYTAMMLCGFKACPADAASSVRNICDYISPCVGGHGAVRDICEIILKQNGKHEEFLDLFTASFSIDKGM